jgi:four helix bundle suffix protein
MEGYKRLTTYILATVICDLNVEFMKALLLGYLSILRNLSHLKGRADYEDFLRQKKLSTWSKDDSRIRVFRAFRAVWKSPNIPNTPNLPNNPEEAANMLLTFCHMESYLLAKQIAALKEKFIQEGGFRENLFRARMQRKKLS